MAGRLTIAGILFALLVPASLGAAVVPRQWHDGEILSRKTVSTGHDYVRKQYVYRVKGFGRSYLVVSNAALHLDLYVPMRFSPGRWHLFIQDADGHECKVVILQAERYLARQ
jgi:hypothetical protein